MFGGEDLWLQNDLERIAVSARLSLPEKEHACLFLCSPLLLDYARCLKFFSSSYRSYACVAFVTMYIIFGWLLLIRSLYPL